MTIETVKEYYAELIETEKKKLGKIKKQIFQVGTLRLLLVLGCCIACYLLWGNAGIITVIILISLLFFLFLLKYHNRLFIKRKYYELKIANAENELKGLDYDFSAFDGAADKVDGTHSFSLDLDIFGNHSFFQSINRTVTNCGRDKLANTVLSPLECKAAIVERQNAIQELSRNPKLLAHFRALGQSSETNDLDIHGFSEQFVGNEPYQKSAWRFAPYLSFLVAVIAIVLYVIDIIPSTTLIVIWVILISITSIPLKKLKNKLDFLQKKLDTLQTYSNLFKIIETEKFESPLLIHLQKKVKGQTTASSSIGQLKKYSDNLFQSFTIPGILIFNPLIAWCILYSIKIEKWIALHKDDLKNWFDAISLFDSLVSLSVFAYNHPDYNYPQVVDDFVFEAKDLGHPMLNRDICVRNDVNINKHPFFLVVTGANMAGKSTYLRTVGLNHMLAGIGAPVCATSLRFYPSRLITNLRTSDSLADNESYFFAELKRLKMIIDRLQAGEQLFIILDEILKGTNSEDKQKGSIALMKQLVALNGNGIIATHDLILGNLEKEYPDAVKNYRFEADIKDEHLSFTYKIREGIAQNMNACFLMRKMGITGL